MVDVREPALPSEETRFFSPAQVIVGSLLSGATLGCLFLSFNFGRNGDTRGARVFRVLSLVALLQALFLPLIFLTLPAVVLLGLFAKSFRDALHRARGNVRIESWWLVATWCGVMLLFWVVVGVVTLTIFNYALVAANARYG